MTSRKAIYFRLYLERSTFGRYFGDDAFQSERNKPVKITIGTLS